MNDTAPYVGCGAIGKSGSKYVAEFYKKETSIPEDKCDELWLSFIKEIDRISEEQLQLLKENE